MVQKEKTKNSSRDNQMKMLIALIVIAVIVAGAAIIISQSGFNPNIASVDYSKIHQERTADGAFILGDPNAPITVVAFEDFLCPHCQDYQTVISKFIQEQVATGNARFEYRFLPAIDATYSFLMAHLAECSEVMRPNSFWEAHDQLFKINSSVRFGPETPRTFAQAMDLDYSKLLECTKTVSQIDTDRKLGDSLGVSGTPTVFVQYGSDGQYILQSPPPSYEQLVALVATAAAMQKK